MSSKDQRISDFLQNLLPKMILDRNEEFRDQILLDSKLEFNDHQEGFMSSLYFLTLKMQNIDGSTTKNYEMVVKIMKGSDSLRSEMNSNAQSMNELHLYTQVIPYFKKFLKDLAITTFNPDKWIPKIYYADAKIIEELGDNEETLLVMENLTSKHFRMGPRVDLDEAHLELMAKVLASYHSVSYSLKIKKDPMFEKLVKGLVPYSLIASDGSVPESQLIYYKYGFERLFNCIAKMESVKNNKNLSADVEILRIATSNNPVQFFENFYFTDETFSVLIHGDCNRNNVLFQYLTPNGYDNPTDIRMIDFQEVRYGSPAIELLFFMYMNMPASIRMEYWDQLIKIYHDTMTKCLMEILDCTIDDPRLNPYSYESFIIHFKNYALFGAAAAMLFLPMMASSEDECERITELYESDYKNEELKLLSLNCGGEEVNKRIMEVLIHASSKGFFDVLK